MSGSTGGTGTKPSLSVCVLTWDGGRRLRGLLAQVRPFADEIVVGVDAASGRRTWNLASRHADVAFRFAHVGSCNPARMPALGFCSGEWVLALDDDERVDGALPALLPALLSDARYTHYWFPRKWLLRRLPPIYVRGLPWFPDWQLRLFRNDPRLVWHAAAPHTPFRVMGAGCHESRTSILHLERLVLTPEQRMAKVERYRSIGSGGLHEALYGEMNGQPLQRLEGRASSSFTVGIRRVKPNRVLPLVQPVLPFSALPPWRAELAVEMPPVLWPGERAPVRISATNRGALRWVPPSHPWPRLYLSYHVRDRAGHVVAWDGARTPVGRVVDPGETAEFLASFLAPEAPGDYLVEWDLVSEQECWFAEAGGAPVVAWVRVRASQQAMEPKLVV